MANEIMTGLGNPIFETKGLAEDFLLPVEPMEFAISGEANKIQARKFYKGRLVIAGSKLNSETYSMTIGIEAVNWLAIQFAFGQLSTSQAAVDFKEVTYEVVPATPFEIPMTLLNDQVFVTVLERGAWGASKPLKRRTTGTLIAGEFKADVSNNKLVFHSSLAGAPIAVRKIKTLANLEGIGNSAAAIQLGNFSFEGIGYCGDFEVGFKIPSIIKTSAPSISLSDVTKFDIEFDLPTITGKSLPFEIWQLPAA
jgi:hypothetical protein